VEREERGRAWSFFIPSKAKWILIYIIVYSLYSEAKALREHARRDLGEDEAPVEGGEDEALLVLAPPFGLAHIHRRHIHHNAKTERGRSNNEEWKRKTERRGG